jgi:putative flippase GtrA
MIFIAVFKNMTGAIKRKLYKHKLYVKYVIAGGTAAMSDFILLFIFTDILHVWYIISATLAFIVAFFVSFFLQKFWTFRDNSRDKMYKQMAMYLAVGATNTCLNAGGMYVLVDKFGVWYIFAQAVMAIGLALGSFVIYRFVIFKKHPAAVSAEAAAAEGEEK